MLFELAERKDRVLVSLDTDFGALLAGRAANKPSLLLFRRTSGHRPSAQSALLLANLPQLADSLRRGAVAVLEDGRIRVRLLPIIGTSRP